MKFKKLSLFVLAVSYCIVAQSQNVPITENGSVVYVTDVNKSLAVGDSTAKTRLRLKNLEIAQDSTPGSGHGQGVGLLNKNYWLLLIDKEGDVFRSKAKFVPGMLAIPKKALPNIPILPFCPVLNNAWQENSINTFKLHLCSKYRFLGINVEDPEKALHIRTKHFTGTIPDTTGGKPKSHQGIRLEDVLEDTITGTISSSIWDIEPIPITPGFSFLKIGTPGNPILTLLESGAVNIGIKNKLVNLRVFGSGFFSDKLAVLTSIPSGFRFGVGGSGYFRDKLAVGATTAGIARTYIQNNGTDVGLYVGNGTPFGQAKIELDGPPATHLWIAENGTRVFSVTAGGKVRIRVNNDNDIAFAVYKGNTENFRITGDGRFFARSYRIKLGSFPDYVFSDSYKRMTFAQKALYFKKYRHLPGLEPAEKIVEDGLDVGNTLVGLTTNVEENSLDIIDINKRVTTLEKENQELNEENDLLKKKNKKAKIIKIGFIEIRF